MYYFAFISFLRHFLLFPHLYISFSFLLYCFFFYSISCLFYIAFAFYFVCAKRCFRLHFFVQNDLGVFSHIFLSLWLIFPGFFSTIKSKTYKQKRNMHYGTYTRQL